jgi:ABC-2 type transport system permease protein
MRERSAASSIRRIAATELRLALRDGRVRLLALLVAALTAAAVAAGWARQADDERERAAAAAASRSQWEGQGQRNPHGAAHFGVWAYRPVPAMAAVDPGLLPWSGAAVWVEAHYQNPFTLRPADDATSLVRFGDGSLAHIVQLFIPLLLLLLGYRAIAGEREQNTWGLLLASGVSPGRIAAGKLVALLGLAGLALAPGLAIAAVATTRTGGAEALGRLALFAAAAALYLAVHAQVVVALSAATRSARTALLCGLVWWFATCIVAPRVASAAAESLVHVPSAGEFWASVHRGMDQGLDGHNPTDQRVKALERETLARYRVSRIEELPVNFDGIRLQAGEEHGNLVFDRLWSDAWDRVARQDRVLDVAGALSPMAGLRRASMAVAATDAPHQRHFADAAERYRRELNRALNNFITDNSRTGDWEFTAGPELWKRLPRFEYRPPALAASSPALAIGFGWLIGWLLAAGGALALALRRPLP